MPTKPPTPCRHPGCPQLVHDGSGFCALHAADKGMVQSRYDQTTRRNDPALAMAKKIRDSANWQKVRALHRQLQPLCCDPLRLHPGIPQPNQNSHHIIPLGEAPDLAYDLGNLGPTCTRCHQALEARERAGKSTRMLFRDYLARRAAADQGPGFAS